MKSVTSLSAIHRNKSCSRSPVFAVSVLPIRRTSHSLPENPFYRKIHEFRRIRIMRCPDGIAAIAFQFFQPPFPDPFRHRCAHWARPRGAGTRRCSFTWCPFNRNPLSASNLISRIPTTCIVISTALSCFFTITMHRVQIGISRRPQAGIRYLYFLYEFIFSASRDVPACFRCLYRFAVTFEHACAQRTHDAIFAFVRTRVLI